MRLHFATVPIHGGADAEEELNRFLASHRVVSVDRHLVTESGGSVWAVCVTWIDGARSDDPSRADAKKARVDYREILTEAQFAVFARLRELRKTIAERDGAPPYAVFTNEQIAEVVRRGVRSAAELAAIEGVGPARVEKHGSAFLDVLRASPTAPTAQPIDAPT